MAKDERTYGVHAALAVIRHRLDAIERAYVSEATTKLVGEGLRALAKARVPYHVVEDARLAKIADAQHHEGICVLSAPRRQRALPEVVRAIEAEDIARVVYLDAVENPHNLGAILRVAAHFGVRFVLGCKLPRVGPAAARIAEGAAEVVDVVLASSPQQALEPLRNAGCVIVATDAGAARSVYDLELPKRIVLAMGAERVGLSDAARSLAAHTVAIPGTGLVESLNVATATAVLLAEHQRRHPGGR